MTLSRLFDAAPRYAAFIALLMSVAIAAGAGFGRPFNMGSIH